MKNLGRSLIEKTMVQIIFALILGGITGISAYFISLRHVFTKLEILLCVSLATFIVAVLTISIYRKLDNRRPQLPKIDPDFRILRHERVH